jgi:riboflavin biosynthesis protein RibD
MMDYTVAMQRAIALAEKGLGKTAPNPIVGAVIINSDGQIIAEGFHDRMSSPDHAEVVAIKMAGKKAVGATMVVTLEPCNHAGETGPCSKAIAEAGISTVVFAISDPNEKAAGGAVALRGADLTVIEGVLKENNISIPTNLTQNNEKIHTFLTENVKLKNNLSSLKNDSLNSSKYFGNFNSKNSSQEKTYVPYHVEKNEEGN